MTLLTTDLLLHNLLGVVAAMVTLMLPAQLVRAVILGISTRLFRLAAFEKIAAADRDAFRRRVGRITLVTVAIFSAAFLVAGMLGVRFGIRALPAASAFASSPSSTRAGCWSRCASSSSTSCSSTRPPKSSRRTSSGERRWCRSRWACSATASTSRRS